MSTEVMFLINYVGPVIYIHVGVCNTIELGACWVELAIGYSNANDLCCCCFSNTLRFLMYTFPAIIVSGK